MTEDIKGQSRVAKSLIMIGTNRKDRADNKTLMCLDGGDEEDIETDRESQVAKSKTALATNTQHRADKKTLMCLGGWDDEGVVLKSVLHSDDDGLTWTSRCDMLVPRVLFSATLCSGSVVVVGGKTCNHIVMKSCHKYNVKSNKWTRIAYLPEARFDHSTSSVRDHLLYVTGGEDRYDNGYYTNTVFTLDVADDHGRWSVAPSMMQKRTSHVSCFLNDVLHVIGGFNYGNRRSCEMLKLSTNTWDRMAPTNYEHNDAGVCTDDVNHIYVAGGFEEIDQCVEVYDVTTGQWSVLDAPLTTVTCGLTLVHHRSTVYAVGGKDDSFDRYDDIQVLDTTANSWSVVGHLPAARSNHATVIF